MSGYYVLNEAGEPVASTIKEWREWFEACGSTRIIGKTEVGDAQVSTVFLGVDHQWGDGPPLLFETMIFEGKHAQDCWRWSTRADAVAGHERIVAALRDGKEPEVAT